jgi:anti-sigma B factor antagonist
MASQSSPREIMQGLEISTGRVGARRDIALFRLRGYLDTETCSRMLNQIGETLKENVFHLIVDMSQVNYVSSAGWGVFVGEIKAIREHGGDLKITQMMPEVADVFEMLEFNRILQHYDCIEEAIDDFDLAVGHDITKSISRAYKTAENDTKQVPVVSPPRPEKRRGADPSRPLKRIAYTKPKIDERNLPLAEKIKAVVIDDPGPGIRGIIRKLDTERFGFTKLGWISAFHLLRKLNLDTKERRIRFYRSR